MQQRIDTTLILVEAEPSRNFAKMKVMTSRSLNAMGGMLSGSTSFTRTMLNLRDVNVERMVDLLQSVGK